VILVNLWELQTDSARAGSIIQRSVVQSHGAIQLSEGAIQLSEGGVGQERGY
jgi:hypothetical protein